MDVDQRCTVKTRGKRRVTICCPRVPLPLERIVPRQGPAPWGMVRTHIEIGRSGAQENCCLLELYLSSVAEIMFCSSWNESRTNPALLASCKPPRSPPVGCDIAATARAEEMPAYGLSLAGPEWLSWSAQSQLGHRLLCAELLERAGGQVRRKFRYLHPRAARLSLVEQTAAHPNYTCYAPLQILEIPSYLPVAILAGIGEQAEQVVMSGGNVSCLGCQSNIGMRSRVCDLISLSKSNCPRESLNLRSGLSNRNVNGCALVISGCRTFIRLSSLPVLPLCRQRRRSAVGNPNVKLL